MATCRIKLQLLIADLQNARHRQRLNLPERERRWPFNVVLLVERTQLPRSRTGFGRKAGRTGLSAAKRKGRKGEPAEQVIPVSVCCE